MEVEQSSYRKYVSGLPAAMLEVQITEVLKDEISEERNIQIWNYFQDPPLIQSIDLRELPNETENENETDDENVDDLERTKLVRFQYDGDLKFDVIFQKDKTDLETCRTYDKLDDDIDSFHVIKSMEVFKVQVEVWNELLGNRCDQMDESKYKVSIISNIGLEQGDKTFPLFYTALDDLTKNALKSCSDLAPPIDGEFADGPCIESLKFDSTKEKTLAERIFATGRPTIGDGKGETRNMHFEVTGGSEVIDAHKAAIFITGSYNKGPGKSFALPTHKPILVLRDPPGGNSYASFENILTTARVVSKSTHISGSASSSKEYRVGVETIGESCAGLGVQLCSVSITTYVNNSKYHRLKAELVLLH